MRRMKRLRSLQKLDSPPSLPLSDTSKTTVIPFGMGNTASKEKAKKYIPASHPRHLCYWERVAISEQLKQGKNLADISRVLQRSRKAICVEINRNGGRYKYNAEEAHKLSIERKQIKAVNLKKSHEKPVPVLTLDQRVENLEMHLDVLTELIRSLKSEHSKINT